MSLFKKIRYWLFPCKHEWVQSAEYWHTKTGEDYDYLLPKPMKYHPGWQVNCYICPKCGQTITTIETLLDMEIIDYNSIDWDAFRREAVKEILAGMMSHPRVMYGFCESLVSDAIDYANELIKQLKEK